MRSEFPGPNACRKVRLLYNVWIFEASLNRIFKNEMLYLKCFQCAGGGLDIYVLIHI